MAKRSSGLRLQPAGGTRASGLPVGKKQILSIERLAHDGRGIAHAEGRTWFVSGALPGEQVQARVLAARSQQVEARVEQVLQASDLRRPAPCALAGQCGGCTLQHLPHAEQVALKQRTLAEQLQRQAGLQPEQWAAPLVGEEFAYRRRARLAVRWDPAQRHLAVGFRAAASQAIVDVEQCPVLVPALQRLLDGLPALLRSLDKPRALGHVELFHGSQTALLLRHTAALGEADLQRLRQFCAAQQAQLWLHGEGQPVADQPAPLGYRVQPGDLELRYQPGDFVQVNAPLNQAMIEQALDWLAPQPDERVLDLFCGLGNFALPLARRAASVVAVEGVASMVERARENACDNQLNNLAFYQSDLAAELASQPWAAHGFAAVLLDPPRDGALACVQHMAALRAQRVLYVSCNPATLARDAQVLAGQGYRLQRAGMIDMFPQTAHVEAMALFVRQP